MTAEENAELRRRLAAYENPHTPPSRRRYPTRSSAGKDGRRFPGRPRGHPGSTRPRPRPDVVKAPPWRDRCEGCGAPLGGPSSVDHRIVEEIGNPTPRQVIDFLEFGWECAGCGASTSSRHPECPPSGRFGRNVLVQATLMKYEERLPHRKVSEALERPFFLWETLPRPISPYFTGVRTFPDTYLGLLKRAVERSLEGVQEVGVWASGGIDSSAALLLASWILGPENVTAIHLDFGYRPDETERVNLVADHLDVRLVVEEMTLDDHLRLLDSSVWNQRSPADFSTQSLMAAQIADREGLHTVLSGLGVDEILGGYPEHVEATPTEFPRVEEKLLWRCQSFYAWVQKAQGAGAGVDVRFPFLDPELIAISRGLPRAAKVEGRETKILLRRALRGDLPEEIVEAGRIAGTKGGFTPSIAGWWRMGLGDWVDEQLRIVPRGLKVACLGPARYAKMRLGLPVNHWILLRLATVPIFQVLVRRSKDR